MELEHLRSFVHVAELLSFSQASRRLMVSQPAVSRRIRELEDELGVRLFDRLGRRVALTADGEYLLRRCRDLVADAAAIVESAHILARGEEGVLRIGGTALVMEMVLPGILRRYRRGQPRVEIRFIQDGWGALLDRVERGEIHLAITRSAEGRRLAARPLFPVCEVAVMSSSHRLSNRKRVEADELAKERLFLLRRGYMSRELFESACNLANIQPLVVMESDEPHSLIAMARAEGGVAIVPSLVGRLPDEFQAVPVSARGKPLGASMAIVWNPARLLPSYAERFIDETVEGTQDDRGGFDALDGRFMPKRLRPRFASGNIASRPGRSSRRS